MKIKYSLFVVIVFLFIELIAQSAILLFGEKKYSLFIKPFSNQISKVTTDYKIFWDYKNNKMLPGRYETKEGVTYNINSKGFRGKEFKKIKEKKRIIAFGGSTTIGVESPDDMTYPAQLEKILNKKNLNYEVINMGFGSKSLNYIKSLYFNEAFKYEPDIILIYSNRNSIMYDGAYVDPQKFNNTLINTNYYLQENIMTYRLMFKTYKRFLNFNLRSDYLKSPFDKKGVSEEYLRTGYVNSLVEIIEFSKQRNIKVILIKQAYFFENNVIEKINKFSVDELVKLYKDDFFEKNYKLDETINFWSVIGTILNKKLDGLENYSNVKIVDPVKSLVSSKKNFVDYLHLTPKGNEVLANEIAKFID